ncbi:hypothetical protein, partial [Bacillus cereus]|uniref:hypothetical protein n=1 Tax=Bacillus cereus TaxID=1396 RepID=UPI0009D4E022
NTEYRVRVRAKGQGTISIVPPGNQKHMLFFTQPNFTMQEFYFYPDANTKQVDLIIQSEGPEFTVDWVEVQEMVYEESTPQSISGGNAVTNTVGIATPIVQTEASMMPIQNASDCQCKQKTNAHVSCHCNKK